MRPAPTLIARLRSTWPSHRSSVQAALFASLTLGLAPFYPHAHIWKQLVNVATGRLTEWIDVVDLVMHGAPWVVLFWALGAWARAAALPSHDGTRNAKRADDVATR